MRRPGGRAPLDRSTSVARYRFDTATAICICCPRRSVLQRPIIVVGEAVTEPIVRRLRAGGNRIRTIGPAEKETAVERGPAADHRFGP